MDYTPHQSTTSKTHKGERLTKRNGSTAVRKAYPFYRDIAQFWQSASLGWKRPQVQVLLFRPPWLARLSIDTPVTSPARILVDLHRDTRKFNQHRLLASFAGIQTNRAKTLKFADRTERCEIRRDSCAMGGNASLVLAEFEIGNAV